MSVRTMSWTRIAWLGGLVALAVAIVLPLQAQQQGEDPAKKAQQAAQPAKADQRLDQQINQAKEELQLLELRLDMERAQVKLAEARLEQAKHWKARYEQLIRTGFVTEERLIAARDEVLMLEAHTAAEKAEVKEAELRVQHARRRLDYGEFPPSPADNRFDELDRRLSAVERKVDTLQHEVGHISREVPPETR